MQMPGPDSRGSASARATNPSSPGGSVPPHRHRRADGAQTAALACIIQRGQPCPRRCHADDPVSRSPSSRLPASPRAPCRRRREPSKKSDQSAVDRPGVFRYCAYSSVDISVVGAEQKRGVVPNTMPHRTLRTARPGCPSGARDRYSSIQPPLASTMVPMAAGLIRDQDTRDSSSLRSSSAPPLPPEMIAPAWPMRLPGGAVTPGDKPDDRLLDLVPCRNCRRVFFGRSADLADHD